MKKKVLCLVLGMIMIYLLISMPVLANESRTKTTINVYNWGEYISDGTNGTMDVNAEFTRRTGIEVNYATFQSNEEMFAKLASGGASYDVIIPSDYMIGKLIDKQMLKKLDFSNIPNFSMIDERFVNPEYDPQNEYSVPYTWGTVGIFYNKTRVSEQASEIRWDTLWNEKYKDQILMFDNSRDAFGISLLRLHKSVNSKNEADWYQAAEELEKQKPLVQAYVMDQIFDKMRNGEAALAPYYAGDAAILMQSNEEIGFVIPKEGTTKFVDAMCIPAGSEHPKEAEAYINFMCDTAVAKANIEHIGYSTPQMEVKTQLDPDIANSEIFYPSEEILNRSQEFNYLPENISLLLDNLWVEVKTGGKGDTALLIAVLLGFIFLYVGIVVYKRKNRKKSFSF